MRIVSYYKALSAEQRTLGGVGQGGGSYWQKVVGEQLIVQIAHALGGKFTLHARPHGKDSYDRTDYEVFGGPDDYDIAYCQLFEVPKTRPAKWVFTILSDYVHMEEVMEDFLARTRPDVVISLQYWDSPLWIQCERYGVRPVFLPWFNPKNVTTLVLDKQHTAMCTGCMGGTYPMRDRFYKHLESLGRSDIVLSGSVTGCDGFKLSDEQYRHALARTQWFFSGGIYDYQIPPKFFEVCNYGAALVSHPMPMMEACGFIDGETYRKIENVDDIADVLASEEWRRIGLAGQQLVHKRHSLQARAQDIANLWLNRNNPVYAAWNMAG